MRWPLVVTCYALHMEVIKQACGVALVGLALGLLSGVARGFPSVDRAGAAVCTAPEQGASPVWLTAEQAKALHDSTSVVFADARPERAYEAGHVSGALHLPVQTGTLHPRATQWIGAASTVVTYCDTAGDCADSTRLAGLLVGAGFEDVRVMEGGFPAWMRLHYPAEAGACGRCR